MRTANKSDDNRWLARIKAVIKRMIKIAMEQELLTIKEDLNQLVRRNDQLADQCRSLTMRISDLESNLSPMVYTNGIEAVKVRPGCIPTYRDFEEVFRGSADLLKARQVSYVDIFKGKNLVVDIGCGRGEFLELLREAGIKTVLGVDVDADMAAICRAKGFEIIEGDGTEFLLSQNNDTIDGIFSSQVVEHLTFDEFTAFMSNAYQKLREHGVIVIETLNPYNLAQYRFFDVDPTHKTRIYPEVAEFVARAVGFADVTTRFIPCYGELRQEDRLAKPWDYCDYVIIANKAGFAG